MKDELRMLKAAVTGRGRDITVGPDGTVHPVGVLEVLEPALPVRRPRATKLAPRVFGRS